MSKLTVKDVDKIVSFDSKELIKVQFEGDIEVEVRPYATIKDMVYIVDGVVDGCFIDGYHPEFKDVLLFRYFIETFTNIPLPKKSKSDDFDKLYEWYSSDLIEWMINADERIWVIYSKLSSMVDEKIEYIKAVLTHPDRDGDIVDAVTGFVNKLTEMINKIGEVDMNEAIPILQQVGKGLAEGQVMSDDTIKKIVQFGGVKK